MSLFQYVERIIDSPSHFNARQYPTTPLVVDASPGDVQACAWDVRVLGRLQTRCVCLRALALRVRFIVPPPSSARRVPTLPSSSNTPHSTPTPPPQTSPSDRTAPVHLVLTSRPQAFHACGTLPSRQGISKTSTLPSCARCSALRRWARRALRERFGSRLGWRQATSATAVLRTT